MKKKTLLITLAIVAVFGISASYMIPSSKRDTDLKQFLKEAGFSKVPGIKSFSLSKEKNYWMDKYGLYFLSYEEMDSLCYANNFIVGESDRFKENIPDASVVEMKTNYDKLKSDIIDYGFEINNQINPSVFLSSSEVGYWLRGEGRMYSFECNFIRENLKYRVTNKGKKVLNDFYNIFSCDKWEMVRVPSHSKIFVVAAPDKFDISGMVINGINLEVAPKPDPIAVIKHRAGYVILTKW